MAREAESELRPRVVHLDLAGMDYVPILGGPPQSASMRSGLVVLSPGKSVGKHSTGDYEELVVVLQGRGELQICGQGSLAMEAGAVVYCPPETEHDVVATGAGPLRYVYVVARAKI